MVNLTIFKINLDVQEEARIYLAWHRGKKGTYDQTEMVNISPM